MGRGRIWIGWYLGLSFSAAVLMGVGVARVHAAYQEEYLRLTVEEPTLSVVVAARTISQGETLDADDLKVVQMDADLVPEAVFHDLSELVGRVPAERVLEGEVLRVERLAAPEAGQGLSALLPQGYRAVSVDITNASALSGFLDPGNYVDVLLTLNESPKGGGATTITVLQGVKVLAVDNRLGESATAARDGAYAPSVTLAVLPEDASKMTHAHEQGKLTLTLRNDVDVTRRTTNGARAATLIGGDEVIAYTPAPKKAAPKPEDPATIDLYRGTKHTEYEVPTAPAR
jgi:pilus assembly protein CpaB